jgi:2-keto-4-pentenoate hydratase
VNQASTQEAADLLWQHWHGQRRMDHLPETLRPRTRAEGYAVQACLDARSASPLFGWKIAATSKVGQAHINVDGPLAGRLLRERAYDGGAEVPFGANHMKVAEAEFAFRMARDLAPRARPYEVTEVLDAADTLHPAIEIPDSRFDDFTVVGAPQLIADDACGHYFVLGPATSADWRAIDLAAHAVKGEIVGRLTRDGLGANVLGDPAGRAGMAGQRTVRHRSHAARGRSGHHRNLPDSAGHPAVRHIVMDFGVLGRVEAGWPRASPRWCHDPRPRPIASSVTSPALVAGAAATTSR